MNENTINERQKTDIGTGVQMSKYLHHNSPASQGNKYGLVYTHFALRLIFDFYSYHGCKW